MGVATWAAMQEATARAILMDVESYDIRYVRPVRPLDFPSADPEWEMGESSRHGRLCEIMYQLLRKVLGPGSTVGADQFVYFNAADPRRKCAPDVFVKRNRPQADIESWKTWEDGTPELCIEILSPRETKEKLSLQQKLRRFHVMGVREVIAYDIEAEPGTRLRAWDLLHGDLVERIVEGEATPCITLDLWLVVAPCEEEQQPATLRLAKDRLGHELVTTLGEDLIALGRAQEEERLAKEQERLAKEQERLAKEQALARVAELEALLATR